MRPVAARCERRNNRRSLRDRASQVSRARQRWLSALIASQLISYRSDWVFSFLSFFLQATNPRLRFERRIESHEIERRKLRETDNSLLELRQLKFFRFEGNLRISRRYRETFTLNWRNLQRHTEPLYVSLLYNNWRKFCDPLTFRPCPWLDDAPNTFLVSMFIKIFGLSPQTKGTFSHA